MSGPDAPRRVHRGLRDAVRAGFYDYDTVFAYLGTGFAVSEVGRLFVPLVGKARLVPAPQEEMRWANAWPRFWHVFLAFVVCIIIGGSSFNGATLKGSLLGALVFPVSFVAILLIWIWRERVVIASWRRMEGAKPDRTALVLAFLAEWSLTGLIVHLGTLIAFVLLILRPWNLVRWPLVPRADQIGDAEWLRRWMTGALLLLFLFVLLRAVYWATRAVLNKWGAARGAA